MTSVEEWEGGVKAIVFEDNSETSKRKLVLNRSTGVLECYSRVVSLARTSRFQKPSINLSKVVSIERGFTCSGIMFPAARDKRYECLLQSSLTIRYGDNPSESILPSSLTLS